MMHANRTLGFAEALGSKILSVHLTWDYLPSWRSLVRNNLLNKLLEHTVR